MPRPKKEESVQVRISRRTQALLDFDLMRTWRLKQAARILGGEKDTPSEIPPAELADARRERLEEIIEEAVGVEGRSSIRIALPELAGSKTGIREALEWKTEQETRLAQECPEAVRVTLEARDFLTMFADKLADKAEDGDD